MQSHRPIRGQIADDGVGKLAFQHNGMGQHPVVEHRVKHRAAAVVFPGGQRESLIPSLPGGFSLNADANLLVHHIPGIPQQLGNSSHLPLDHVIGKRPISSAVI